jgi:UDP-glucose 4-epimerase
LLPGLSCACFSRVRRDGWEGSWRLGFARRSSRDGLDVVGGADTHIVGSVLDGTIIERGFVDYGIEAVVHAGALHQLDIARVPAQSFIGVNVTGTLNLLRQAVKAGHDRFVLTSTTSLM